MTNPYDFVAPALIQGALDFVNEIRNEHGAEPLSQMPCGERLNGNACPIAVGLRDLWPTARIHVGGYIRVTSAQEERVVVRDVSEISCAFMRAFDRGPTT